jgi:transcriptional regulator with XRE-family HTH domain
MITFVNLFIVVVRIFADMIERFKSLLENLNLAPSEFADRIGVQRSSISHILSGRNKPSIDFLEKILVAFPETDVNYLITGKKRFIESAIKDDSLSERDSSEKDLITGINKDEKKIPVPDVEGPVEKIIIVYRNNTFRILLPSSE